MRKSYRTFIGVGIILVFGIVAVISLVGSATPYVGFKQAMAMQSKVQILGKVDQGKTNYNESTGVFRFSMMDEDGEMIVVDYSGTKPGNFEQAESVVAIGVYKDGVFEAENLLVKCPSKYQGTEYENQ